MEENRCEGGLSNEAPHEYKAHHAGKLIAHSIDGKRLLVCERHKQELVEINAFMSRRMIGDKESEMLVTKIEHRKPVKGWKHVRKQRNTQLQLSV